MFKKNKTKKAKSSTPKNSFLMKELRKIKTKKKGILSEEIARKAYELFEQRGRTDGSDLDDWLQAEKMVGKS